MTATVSGNPGKVDPKKNEVVLCRGNYDIGSHVSDFSGKSLWLCSIVKCFKNIFLRKKKKEKGKLSFYSNWFIMQIMKNIAKNLQ